jgi:fructokinase
MPDIITLGEPIIDMVATEPSPDLVSALHFTKAAGGAPINVAAAVARLGGSAGVIAKAGGDHFGEFMRRTLEGLGVDLEGFLQDPECPTQLAFVSKDANGVPDFAFHVKQHSADTMLEIDDIDAEYIGAGVVFHFGTITLIHEPARSATRHALRVARDQGLLISLDPNLRPTLWPSPDEALRVFLQMVPECDVLKVSAEELYFLTAQPDLEAAAQMAIDMGPELVLVTRGAEGAYFHRADGARGSVPGFPVEVVDTVGCGDAFVGAMLLQLVEAEPEVEDLTSAQLEQMVRFANAAAALTATGAGVMGSLPERGRVVQMLEGPITSSR